MTVTEMLLRLAPGVVVTVQITVVAAALVMAILAGIGRLSHPALLRWIAGAYVELLRRPSASGLRYATSRT